MERTHGALGKMSPSNEYALENMNEKEVNELFHSTLSFFHLSLYDPLPLDLSLLAWLLPEAGPGRGWLGYRQILPVLKLMKIS